MIDIDWKIFEIKHARQLKHLKIYVISYSAVNIILQKGSYRF